MVIIMITEAATVIIIITISNHLVIQKENISHQAIMSELDDLISHWARERRGLEAFGDFVIRAGIVKPVIVSARDFYELPACRIGLSGC